MRRLAVELSRQLPRLAHYSATLPYRSPACAPVAARASARLFASVADPDAVHGESIKNERIRALVDMFPGLPTGQNFSAAVEQLSDEEFRAGKIFLRRLQLMTSDRALTPAELQQLRGDFMLVSAHLPGMPVGDLLGDLQLSLSKHAARHAMQDAAKRAAAAEQEAKRKAAAAEQEAKRKAAAAERADALKAAAAEQEAKRKAAAAEQEAKRKAAAAERADALKAALAEREAKRKAAEAEREAAEQQKLDTFMPEGNVMWSLHRIVADKDSMGLCAEEVANLQALFGWTLSMSRAMHGGEASIRAWLKLAGVDAYQLDDQYQCVSQEADGETLVGARVKPSPIPGVQQVLSTYERAGSTVEVATSLLMHAPVHQLSGGKDIVESVSASPKRLVHAAIPTVRPQLHAQGPVLTGETKSLYSVPLVLTPPRIQLLLRIARCFGTSRGVKLTGVHGAGKSMLLQALAGVFPVGHPCDVLYVENAKQLLEQPRVCAQQLVQSSGPITDSRAVGKLAEVESKHAPHTLEYNQDQAKAQWDTTGKLRRNLALRWWNTTCVAHHHSDHPDGKLVNGTMYFLGQAFNGPPCGRVYIFDEVNELLKAMRGGQASLAPGAADGEKADVSPVVLGHLKSHLPWRTTFPLYHFRILASSPDGLREESPHVSGMPFYELRPTRFDHLAAIVHAAPEYICPGLDTRKAFGDCESTSLLQAMHACRALCGNMREVAVYLDKVKVLVETAATSGEQGTGAQELAAQCADALLTVRDAYTKELARRLVESHKDHVSQREPESWEGNPYVPSGYSSSVEQNAFKAALMNASMGVRKDPTKHDSEHDLLGFAVMSAFVRAMSGGLLKLLKGANSHLFKAVALSDPHKFLADGAAMENEVHRRLALQALSARQWRLSALHELPQLPALQVDPDEMDKCSLEQLVAAMQPGVDTKPMVRLQHKHVEFLNKASRGKHDLWLYVDQTGGPQFPPEVIEVQQSTANQTTIVDSIVRTTVDRLYKREGCLLIKTANNFPGVDFVFVKCVGSHCSVTFVEVTKSTLRKHAASTDFATLQVSLKDLARLTHQDMLTAQHTDGRWYFADKRTITALPASLLKEQVEGSWKLPRRQTAANFWLELLGCPLRVKAQIGGRSHSTEADKKHFEQLRVTVEADHAKSDFSEQDEAQAEASTAAEQTWDVSVVYVSGSKSQPRYDEYADLDCGFAYGVFLWDLTDAKSAWATPRE